MGSFAAPRLALSVVSREWAPRRGGATGRGAGGSELQQQSPGGPMPRGPATGGGGGLATPVGHVGDRPPRRGSFRGRLVSLRREAHPKCWARCGRKTHRPTLKTQEKGAIKAPECEALSFLPVLAVWHRVFSLLFEAGLPRHQGTHRTAVDLHRSPCFATLTTGSCHGLPDCPLLPATPDLPQTDKAVTSPSQGPTAPSR